MTDRQGAAESGSSGSVLTAVKPTALHALPEHPLVLQDTRSSADSPQATPDTSNAPEPNDGRDHLPRRAPDEDAQAARDKLDRIAKAQQAKRNWAKSTGVTLVSKAFGRNDRRQRRRRHGLSSDEDDSEDESHDNEATRGNIDEVRLMITGNPVVTKVVGAANRARGRFRGQTGSPEASPQTEEGPWRFTASRPGSSLAKRFRPPSTTPPPATTPFGTNLSPSSEAAPHGSSLEQYAAMPSGPRSKARNTLGPELLVVDEEGQSRQATDTSQPKSNAHLNLPPSSRSSNNHTPSSIQSSSSSNPVNVSGLAPQQSNDQRDSSSSITGGVIHDEPDVHDHDTIRRPLSPAASSASDVSSDDELDDSVLGSDLDQDGDAPANLNSLSLEHGDSLTKEELKRRKKLIRREIRRRKANGEPIDDLIHLHSKVGQLGHKVSRRVSKSINIATSSGRNRRAMDRYSPHPTALTLQTSDLPRSTSAQSAGGEMTFSAITPSMSRNSNHFGQRRESVATFASSRRSSLAADDDDDDASHRDGDGASTLRKNSMIDRSFLSSRNSIRKYLHAPNVIKRRRQKKWEAEMDAIERAADEEARHADPDAEIDHMLAKYAQQQAPADADKTKYEFDVLYENQRGLLVFGIPKFSPRTLFQWDPSPWTSSNGKKSAYNIANAQLPDPSWEWAYDEWYIDMTGDVDEAGWQYSGNFGRRFWPNVHFPHGRLGLPKTGVDGIMEMNARVAQREKKRQEQEDTKEDGGFEAIKRTARARTSKWTGSPDPWTFVRRRRWIRLRRRKPLTGATKAIGSVTPPIAAASPAHEVPVPDEASKMPLSPGRDGIKPGQSDDELEAESSLDGSDESDSSSSEDDPMLYAPAYGRPSGFLPRRLPGHMANGSNPAKSKVPKLRRKAQKHAKEFTGSIRELKSLLPSIIAMDREARVTRAPTGLTASQSSYKWAMLKINKLDARNPFISWHFVKHRLQDQDMAFAATTLRSIERKYQQRQLAAMKKKGGTAPDSHVKPVHPPMPSTFAAPSRSIRFDGLAPEADTAYDRVSPLSADRAGQTDIPTPSRLQEPFTESPVEGHELTRGALVEINFARVLRVLRACKIDRQRMDLWKLWLGVVSLDTLMETARREDLAALGLLAPSTEDGGDSALQIGASSPPMDMPHMSGGSSFRYRQRAERARSRWRASTPMPDASDVWDVLERKLDEVLLLFEFQSNRAQFIRMLLAVHEKLHPDHVFRDHSLRTYPVELSPAHVHGDAAEMGGPTGPGGAFGSRLGGWKRAGLPRLEFYSDLQRILAAVPGNDATVNAEYILSQPEGLQELEMVAMPMEHHGSNALVDKLEAEALSDSFLDHEKIPSGGATGLGIQRPRKEASKRLSATLPDKTGSRSPSPVSRAPSVPLPYRHSPLAAAEPVNQGSMSTHDRSSASFTDRVGATGSTESTPPSSAPDGTREESGHDSKTESGQNKEVSTTATPTADTEAGTQATQTAFVPQQAPSNGPARTEATIFTPISKPGPNNKAADHNTASIATSAEAVRHKRTTPRPPIPVRSGSVSPQKPSKDRF
ncbi:hypothetical protein PSEUBRA_004287 [Kalmanozyma brasiliensis GHG001]|uniref:uncharacterized protein n=1 Tax=Kalmanozyma brasiliensis (strain GHG001) TaxID=1365824 RepID=UPI0028680AB4|nr:uncharacterized protein PSEUBRA_004287 [Kalmanozyma brasiliensis GHG001]KAF6767363.1 hypothetical protein PSEUBRA_004287 [Kalmanozyma brasiliensis GHG001]